MPVDQPQNARSRRTRTQLLNSARSLIEKQGFESLTLAAVAEGAGVSHRALYLHFRSRSDLLTTLYRHLGEAEELADSLARVWASPDARSALAEWAAHIARSHPRILGISRAVERARFTDPDAKVLWNLTMRNWMLGCTRLATWLDEEGCLADPWTVESAADMLWTLMSWDVTERLVVSRRWSRRRYAEGYANLLLSTFAVPART
jgi:AcrR family transcriptional regulator